MKNIYKPTSSQEKNSQNYKKNLVLENSEIQYCSFSHYIIKKNKTDVYIPSVIGQLLNLSRTTPDTCLPVALSNFNEDTNKFFFSFNAFSAQPPLNMLSARLTVCVMDIFIERYFKFKKVISDDGQFRIQFDYYDVVKYFERFNLLGTSTDKTKDAKEVIRGLGIFLKTTTFFSKRDAKYPITLISLIELKEISDGVFEIRAVAGLIKLLAKSCVRVPISLLNPTTGYSKQKLGVFISHKRSMGVFEHGTNESMSVTLSTHYKLIRNDSCQKLYKKNSTKSHKYRVLQFIKSFDIVSFGGGKAKFTIEFRVFSKLVRFWNSKDKIYEWRTLCSLVFKKVYSSLNLEIATPILKE